MRNPSIPKCGKSAIIKKMAKKLGLKVINLKIGKLNPPTEEEQFAQRVMDQHGYNPLTVKDEV